MRLLLISIFLTALAACSGLPSGGQFAATGKSIGAFVGTDPVNAGFSASIGYKGGTVAYNPQTTGGGDDGDAVEVLIRSHYGTAEDSSSFIQWDGATAEIEAGASAAGGRGGIGLETGMAMGPAATFISCGLANGAGGTNYDCTTLFD